MRGSPPADGRKEMDPRLRGGTGPRNACRRSQLELGEELSIPATLSVPNRPPFFAPATFLATRFLRQEVKRRGLARVARSVANFAASNRHSPELLELPRGLPRRSAHDQPKQRGPPLLNRTGLNRTGRVTGKKHRTFGVERGESQKGCRYFGRMNWRRP